MQRLKFLNNQLSQVKYVEDSLKFLKLTELITPEDEAIRQRARMYAEKEVAPFINDFVETATFPEQALKKIKDYKLFEALLKPPYGQGASNVAQGLIMAELARVDGGLGLFFASQFALTAKTLELLASEEQKNKYLTKMRDLEYFGGWGLTEENYGSDASSLESNVRKVDKGYVLNGNKRWIGNGNRDILIVWARNLDNNNVEGFIIENKWKGVKSEPIKNKLACRVVQNCQIYFDNVFIPDENKLEKVKDWNSGANLILMNSRITFPWLSVGLCMGVYDNVIKYISERKQFKVPLASFQMQQEKLVRIISTTQAVFMLALRLTQLSDMNKATIGMSSAVKAWITLVTRDVAKLGREMMGGNGIISDNYCIRAILDAEVMYTGEGSYDVSCLVAGRELTGIAAFRSK